MLNDIFSTFILTRRYAIKKFGDRAGIQEINPQQKAVFSQQNIKGRAAARGLTVALVSSHAVRRHANVFVLGLLRLLSFLPEPFVVLHQLHHVLHLLTHVHPLVLAILIYGTARFRPNPISTPYPFPFPLVLKGEGEGVKGRRKG